MASFSSIMVKVASSDGSLDEEAIVRIWRVYMGSERVGRSIATTMAMVTRLMC